MIPTNIFTANYIALPGLKPGAMFYGTKCVDSIIDSVTLSLGVERMQLKAKTRLRHIVEARQIAIFLIKKHTNMSLAEIGRLFGGRDHTTAIHSIQVVNDLCDSDEQYKQRLLQIENLL